jgi:hypothetical protein
MRGLPVRDIVRRRPWLLLLIVLTVAAASCADQPRIWFQNERDEPVTVAIDGDRLIILKPRSGEWLPYSTAAWAWPRRIDVATYDGRLLWTQRMDADDLARALWTVYIRP